MTNEEAIKILQGMNLDLMYPNGEYAVDGLPEDKLKMYLATRKAIDALRRAQPANEPLSIAQLKQMDGEPVRHGRWLINSDGYYPYCSVCKEEPKSGIMTHYCPNCGAKMDKEDE